jgi:hypothetical protein
MLHIALHHVPHKCNVHVRSKRWGGNKKDVWHIDDSEVLLVGSVDFDLQHVLAEGLQACILLGHPDAHGAVCIADNVDEVLVIRAGIVSLKDLRPSATTASTSAEGRMEVVTFDSGSRRQEI